MRPRSSSPRAFWIKTHPLAPGVGDDQLVLVPGVGFGRARADIARASRSAGSTCAARFGTSLAQLVAPLLGVDKLGVARDLAGAHGRQQRTCETARSKRR